MHVPQTSFEEFLDYRPAFIISHDADMKKNLNYYVEDGHGMKKIFSAAMNLKKLDRMWVNALTPSTVNLKVSLCSSLACGQNGEIGLNGELPWEGQYPEDREFYAPD